MVKVTTSMIDVYSNAGVFPTGYDSSMSTARTTIVNNNNNNNNVNSAHNKTTNNDHTNVNNNKTKILKHYRSHSFDAAEILCDSSSSDSETSFFDDSDDNDEVTAFFGRQGRELGSGMHRGEIRARDVRQNNKINEIWRKSSRYSSSQIITKTVDYGVLVSPRLTRKNTIATSKINNKKHQHRNTTIDDAMFALSRSPGRNYSVPDLSSLCRGERNCTTNANTNGQIVNKENIRNSRSPSPTEEELMRRNSYLLSPRLKRKQIDITKSSAYKEIYAHNLRLYSAVLAKQIATSSQVGREMNEIRRNKLKERALNTESSNDNSNNNNIDEKDNNNNNNTNNKLVYRRSMSFGNGISSTKWTIAKSESGENNASQETGNTRRSKSANSEFLKNQIEQCIPKLKDTTSTTQTNAEGRLSPRDDKFEAMRIRSQSLPAKDLVERISRKSSSTSNFATIKDDVILSSETLRDERTIAAYRRKEQVQKKLESFDLMFGKTTDFLIKVKTMRK